MGVQACRLPALKPLKHLKRLKTLKSCSERRTVQAIALLQGHIAFQGSLPALKSTAETFPWHASSCSQQAPQGHTSMASYGRPSLPFASP